MSGGKFIAETFKGYGVTHVFFVEAILRLGLVEMEALGIRRVLAHTEKAAAYMADGYARASHRPGICLAQSVGAANLAAGLQDAYLGLSPVIAITGQRPPLARHRNAYQEVIHGPLFEPVTKYNVSVETVEQLPFLLRQAFREVTSGAPGPAHLDVAGHLGEIVATGEADLDVVIEESFRSFPSVRPEPDLNLVREAGRILAKADRPVIVAGGGATASSAGPEIVELAEILGETGEKRLLCRQCWLREYASRQAESERQQHNRFDYLSHSIPRSRTPSVARTAGISLNPRGEGCPLRRKLRSFFLFLPELFQEHRADDDHAFENHLRIRGDIEKIEDVVENSDDARAQQCVYDAAVAAAHSRPAYNDAGDDIERVLGADAWISDRNSRGHHDAARRGEKSADCISGELIALRLYA
jgi:hypothetical protein